MANGATPVEKPPAAEAVSKQPDLNTGIDGTRFGTDNAYMEALSATAQKLTAATKEIRTTVGDDPRIVEFGNMTAANTLVVYWSGPSDVPALATMKQIAARAGITLLVAERKTTRAQLEAATTRLEKQASKYKSQGLVLSAFGGFAADFDGVKVTVKEEKSAMRNAAVVDSTLESDLGVPVQVTVAATENFVGRYDDSPPFNAGGLMVGSNNTICTSGFGLKLGSTRYRYLSARHCLAPSYTTETGRYSMGTIEVSGTGHNGAATFSAGGSALVFDGGSAGNPTVTRTLTQRDPALSTVGTPVCQSGANHGQRCGTIAQVAVTFNDGLGNIRTNFVTSPANAVLAGGGDSGGPVISLHTLARAWAVGVLIGGQGPFQYGAACGQRYYAACSRNFYFNNIDYAMGGFTGYAVRYY